MELTKEDKKFVKQYRNEMKIFEKSFKKHLEKHKREMILRRLE